MDDNLDEWDFEVARKNRAERQAHLQALKDSMPKVGDWFYSETSHAPVRVESVNLDRLTFGVRVYKWGWAERGVHWTYDYHAIPHKLTPVTPEWIEIKFGSIPPELR